MTLRPPNAWFQAAANGWPPSTLASEPVVSTGRWRGWTAAPRPGGPAGGTQVVGAALEQHDGERREAPLQAGDLLHFGALGVGREQGDQAAGVARPREAPEHGGEVVVPRELDAGEGLHDRLDVRVTGAVAGVDAVGGDEAHERAPLPARGH